ncbi:MAG: Co2+/Mg2+ efflux protein ApaG [Rickettsiaceae bacterium]|nr:Co2+/Mg2+ efflux protein ApaG [Rickettsiaceae bacterium]
MSNNIEVSVRPFYAAELSSSSSHSHVYIYKIKIKNHSPDDIKLLSREWNIAQEDGFFEIVRGEGVVGKQPVIKSGGEFEYASQAILFAPSGMMYGSFYCLNLHTWKNIEVKIPAFSLDREVVIQ